MTGTESRVFKEGKHAGLKLPSLNPAGAMSLYREFSEPGSTITATPEFGCRFRKTVQLLSAAICGIVPEDDHEQGDDDKYYAAGFIDGVTESVEKILYKANK